MRYFYLTFNFAPAKHLTQITRFFIAFLFSVCLLQFAKAQDSKILLETGVSLNGMNCFTDLGGTKGVGGKFLKDFNTGKSHISGGVFLSALYNNKIGIRIEGTLGKVSADDNVLVGVTGIASERYNRNLLFRSKINEVAVLAEIHPLAFFFKKSFDEAVPRFSPYFLGGVGYFSFNPQGLPAGSTVWVDLQPLSTEGQGFANYQDRQAYKLKQVNFPVGFGLKYDLTDRINLRLEGLYRILTTDYLDDVSKSYINPNDFYTNFDPAKAALAAEMADRQLVNKTNPLGGGKRGSPAEKDSYVSVNFKLSFALGRGQQEYQ